MTEERHTGGAVGKFLAPIRRLWPLVVLAGVLVALASVALELRQERLYEARAQVFMSRVAVDARLIGAPNALAAPDLGDLSQNQAELARTRRVAERTLEAVGAPSGLRAVERFRRRSTATPAFAGVLHFEVRDEDAARAPRLATEWARQTTEARRELDTQALARALAGVDERLAQLGPGARDSEVYLSLIDKQQQLRTMESLQVANGTMIEPAGRAKRIGGQPVQKGISGLVVGLALGAALALIWDRLHPRVRSSDELAGLLGLPLLARVGRQGDPDAAEAVRTLRARLELSALRTGAKAIALAGAGESDPASPTVAELGASFARTGRRVVVVDLDLRLPSLHHALGAGDRPGVTDVVRGEVELTDALVAARSASSLEDLSGSGAAGRNGLGGWLDVLPAGAPSPEDTELVGTLAVAELLERLRELYDVVLVDATAFRPHPDTSLLAAHVDGMVLVRSASDASPEEVDDLRDALAPLSAKALGLVVLDDGDGEPGRPDVAVGGRAPLEREPERVP